jgi:dihydropteroate synthase
MMVDATAGETATRTWTVGGRRPVTVRQPAGLMGVINATPDSFSDGGSLPDAGAAAAAGERMVAAGAAWLDVGGASSRPGAAIVAAAVELARVLPVIRALRARGVAVPVSIDSCHAEVARAALEAGADAINDISAGADPDMFALAASWRCPLILMHMQGPPATMQQDPHYADVVGEVEHHLAGRMRAALAGGVAESALLLDPGIGFGKRLEHNLALLRALPRLAGLGRPLVVGISRKSFIASLLGEPAGARPARERDGASHVLHALLAGSCALLRVHDVPGAAAALTLARALAAQGGGDAD